VVLGVGDLGTESGISGERLPDLDKLPVPVKLVCGDFLLASLNTLRSGEFPRLRKCPRCPKFFVAKDLKRKFCSDRCKDEHHTERRKKERYSTKLWQTKRERALARAGDLLKRGEPLAQVSRKTKLTEGILRSNGLIS
jgi:hypothetical protein